MQSLMPLYRNLLLDASRWCSASTTRDFETITRREKCEGLSFLTITLPDFCKDFEQALHVGQIGPGMFRSFAKHKALPKFLSGLLVRVFSLDNGLLLDHPCVTTIYFIRQILLLSKKIEVPCTPERERKAFDAYVKCEQEVSTASRSFSFESLDSFDLLCDCIWGHTLGFIDREVHELNHVPKHGPGATADRVTGNSKYVVRTWSRRLEENFFPSADFVIPNFGFYEDLRDVNFLEPGEEMPVKVVSVPKTLKTPRIIAIEPTHMQYAQQSLMELFVRHLEGDDLFGSIIGFTDQVPNQALAQLGSRGGGFATLDLSEASDRVSLRLVTRLLNRFPSLMRAVMACRSTSARLPTGDVIRLRKFASMGSALCFPIEAMVFTTIVFLGIQKAQSRRLERRDLYRFRNSVRVFGDDIVVPEEYAETVMETLEAFGLRVNRNKSFWTGKFRESCGSDWYDGETVKPVYLRRPLPTSRRDAREFASIVSFRNQAYELGLWETCKYLDQLIGRLAPFPVVHDSSPLMGRKSYLSFVSNDRFDDALHKPMAKGVLLKSKTPDSPLDGPWALQKYFLKRGKDPYFDKYHLARYGRPDNVTTIVRWANTLP